MSSKGWIKVHRQTINHWIWEDPVKAQMWITMLLEVNYTHGKMVLGNSLLRVERGSSTNSIRTWARLFNCGPKATVSFFDLLESDEMITRKTIGKGKHSTTLINITNYEEYQTDRESLNDTLTTTIKNPKGKHERHTIEEIKNTKELKKERRDVDFCAPSVNEVLHEMENLGLESIEAEKESQAYFNHYESNGWKVGKNKMVSWKPSVSSWIKRISDFKNSSSKNYHHGNDEQRINRQTANTINQNLQGWDLD
ncbi:hypothetical protein C7S20_16715 [Christiangramia fulva]|uniref:Uncharacterized protein n=1 Tax=Christiangramia fulva TaxID=2126553 RepID=A0A2R3Z926_9FLAO|nr:hypothetical protein [Christiangramia fulva]AVR46771.1 hypothetical protein C7S20_16715 [Christiangramia fulva]